MWDSLSGRGSWCFGVAQHITRPSRPTATHTRVSLTLPHFSNSESVGLEPTNGFLHRYGLANRCLTNSAQLSIDGASYYRSSIAIARDDEPEYLLDTVRLQGCSTGAECRCGRGNVINEYNIFW